MTQDDFDCDVTMALRVSDVIHHIAVTWWSENRTREVPTKLLGFDWGC